MVRYHQDCIVSTSMQRTIVVMMPARLLSHGSWTASTHLVPQLLVLLARRAICNESSASVGGALRMGQTDSCCATTASANN